MNNADMIVRIPLNLPRSIQKKARERIQQAVLFPQPHSCPNAGRAYPALRFCDLEACSVPASVDSACDSSFPCPLDLVSVSAPEPVDLMHITYIAAAFQ